MWVCSSSKYTELKKYPKLSKLFCQQLISWALMSEEDIKIKVAIEFLGTVYEQQIIQTK